MTDVCGWVGKVIHRIHTLTMDGVNVWIYGLYLWRYFPLTSLMFSSSVFFLRFGISQRRAALDWGMIRCILTRRLSMMGVKEMFGGYNNGPLSFYGFSLLFKDSLRYGSRVAGEGDDWAVVYVGFGKWIFGDNRLCFLQWNFLFVVRHHQQQQRTIEESHPPKATKPLTIATTWRHKKLLNTTSVKIGAVLGKGFFSSSSHPYLALCVNAQWE